ncbi:MAG TPA: ABC transporter permease [Bryobacteraceae bacterium]|jgi:predicted permease
MFRHRRKQSDFNAELEAHLELETDRLVEQGLGVKEARFRALHAFGNPTRARESFYESRRWLAWDHLLQDLRYAGRTMLNNKAFTALAALSLALGIGANTAIYSFLNAILLRSLPVSDPSSLVMLRWHTHGSEMHGMGFHDDDYFEDPQAGFTGGIFPFPAFELIRQNNSVFSSIFAYQGTGNLNLVIDGQAEQAKAEYVSGDYFHGLGVPPVAGRLLGAEDDHAGAPAVAILSFALSQKRFGEARNAVGRPILINGIPFTVAGVIPPDFFGVDADLVPDLYLPMHSNLLLDAANSYSPPARRYVDPNVDWVEIMARLRPGLSLAQAQGSLAPLFHRWEITATNSRPRTDLPRLAVQNGGRGLDGLRRKYSKPLYILLALVSLILAIACANIANLLLARAACRNREIAVRLSVGAGRLRIIRQLLTESILLASVGGALGVALAIWGTRSLTFLLANGRENFTLRADLNWHVLGVAAALSVLTGILFGLAPAMESTRADIVQALKESSAGTAHSGSVHHTGLSRMLMVAQIAFAMLIVMAAGLFVRTVSNLESIDLGFNRENLLTFQLDASQGGRRSSQLISFYHELRTRFSEVPGVRTASFSNLPLMGGGRFFTTVAVAGVNPKTSKVMAIGPDFFKTMQIPILLGREIDGRDRPGSSLTVVVNEAFARANFATRNPLGEHLTLPHECEKCSIRIVGVSGNVRQGELKEDVSPMVYLPLSQGTLGPAGGIIYELRATGNPLSYIHAAREIVHRADARLPVSDVKTQSALIDNTINQEIVFARLCSLFALLALAIAGIGLYGTMSYNVVRRTGEIGIRMALGAQRKQVIRMVLGEVIVLAAAGLATGVPAAFAASKLIKSFLFGVEPNDPLTFTATAATLASVALLAGYVPARNASRIDPLMALRHE